MAIIEFQDFRFQRVYRVLDAVQKILWTDAHSLLFFSLCTYTFVSIIETLKNSSQTPYLRAVQPWTQSLLKSCLPTFDHCEVLKGYFLYDKVRAEQDKRANLFSQVYHSSQGHYLTAKGEQSKSVLS